MNIRPKGFIIGGVIIGVRDHGLYKLIGKRVDHKKQKKEKI